MLRQAEQRFSQRGNDRGEGEISNGPRNGPQVWVSRRQGNTGKMSCVSIRTPPSQGLKSERLKHQVREEQARAVVRHAGNTNILCLRGVGGAPAASTTAVPVP